MALVVKDRVQETTLTVGTISVVLAGSSAGFQTFSSAIGNGNTTYYCITGGSEWEVGLGTVGIGTLSRDTVLESSNGGSLVNFSAGTKQVFCTYPAERAVLTDSLGALATQGDGDKGDITVSSSGTAWTIDNSVVTTAKLGGDITTAGKALLDDATVSDQRTTLGLGTISTQSAASVAITGGTITGIIDLAIADGGTGASNAAAAFTNIKQAATTTDTGVVELATDEEVVTGTDTTKVVTPASMKAGLNASGTSPIYACRAWVNFNGAGTVAIRASGNVSSITDDGVGRYLVNMTTALPDANYSVCGSAAGGGTNANGNVLARALSFTQTTSQFDVRSVNTANSATALVDSTLISVAVFR